MLGLLGVVLVVLAEGVEGLWDGSSELDGRCY